MTDRPPPDRDRGPRRTLGPRAARLADRAAETDRSARFATRYERLTAARRRRERRQRALAIAGWTLAAVVALATGAATWGWLGALAGLAAVGVVCATARAVTTMAARRGASAWDWRAQRYRLYGDPAARVQALDDPEERAVGRLTGAGAGSGRRRAAGGTGGRHVG